MTQENLAILLVEDDEDDALLVRNLIREGWGQPGPVVDHTTDAREAAARIANKNYDLFIFDYRLGEMEGIELLKILKAKNIPTPIIFLTGQGDQEIAVEVMKAGATDYLDKSKLSAETLGNSMRYALKLHQEAVRRKITEQELKKSHNKLTSAHSELQCSVNKLKSAQNQIMRTEKLAGIGRLAAGVCHEILNPLNIISGHSQALLMERKDDESLVEDLRSIMEEIQRIEKIIGGLLKFSRKGDMDLKAMDINRELESALSILEKDMNLEGIQVCREFDLELPTIPLDTDRLRQVFLNIINNAKYAMKNNGGGTLTVTTEFLKEKNSSAANPGVGENGKSPLVRIRFSDSGPGIKKEDQQKIFDPFFTTKPEDQGTGLGLSVCHTIIEKHGGSLEVESAESKGATFIIDLPLEQEIEEVPV